MSEVKEKNLGGRPPMFDTPQEMEKAIQDYFDKGIRKRTVIIGKEPNQKTIEIPVPTITGLCYHIGFESRQSFYAYEDRDGFSYTVKKARLFIEREYEEMLINGNTTGAIFALKNMGWKDERGVDLSNKGGKFETPQPIDYSQLPIEVLQALVDASKPK